MSAPDRRAMVERLGKDLSVRRQCVLLSLTRSGVYRSKPVAGADDLAVMRRIDELHLELPFYGSRRMTFELNKEGRGVNRKRVRRLMRVMGIEALVPRPGTSKAAPGHKIYPYLLRGLKIVEPNHVWAADVTYIPMACGFLYLVAIIDWASRAVLAWRLSNTNDASFCAAALEEALLRFGKPRIFNSDQGSTFTAEAHMGVFGSSGQLHRHIKKLRWLFRYPRSEPYFMTGVVPHQIKLTSGRRSKQLHQYPAFGGWGSGGRDHSFTRLFKPVLCSVPIAWIRQDRLGPGDWGDCVGASALRSSSSRRPR